MCKATSSNLSVGAKVPIATFGTWLQAVRHYGPSLFRRDSGPPELTTRTTGCSVFCNSSAFGSLWAAAAWKAQCLVVCIQPRYLGAPISSDYEKSRPILAFQTPRTISASNIRWELKHHIHLVNSKVSSKWDQGVRQFVPTRLR